MANLADIKEYLNQSDVPYKIVDVGTNIFNAEAIKESGVNPDEVIKTLIIRIPSEQSDQKIERSFKESAFLALVVRGRDRVDFKKVRALYGKKSEFAKPRKVKEIVGVPVGAVCPVLLEVPLVVDRVVLDLEKVHMGSGELNKGLEMNANDFLQVIGTYTVEDLVV